MLSSPEVLKVKTPTKFYKKKTRTSSTEAATISTPSSLTSMYKGPNINTPTQRLSRKCIYDGPQRRLSRKCLFEENVGDTPKTKRLKGTASNLFKKNKAQRAQIGRLRAKSKHLQQATVSTVSLSQTPKEQTDLLPLAGNKIVTFAGPSGSRAEDMAVPVASTSTSSTENSKKVTLEECSMTYFAGYLAKSCIEKNSCQVCAKNLLQEINLKDNKQLLILNKSYNCSKCIKLKMPSDNLLKLVHMAIACFNMHFSNIVHSTKIKLRLFNSIVDFLRCEAPELLNMSCEKHLFYIIDHMILVKIHFYCKNKKSQILEPKKVHPKLRILKNK